MKRNNSKFGEVNFDSSTTFQAEKIGKLDKTQGSSLERSFNLTFENT